MKIEHVCLNVKDIEKEKNFYCQVFGFTCNQKYHNDKTGWENYFLSSREGGARLELLSHAGMPLKRARRNATCIVHLSLALGSQQKVKEITEQIAAMGYEVLSSPPHDGRWLLRELLPRSGREHDRINGLGKPRSRSRNHAPFPSRTHALIEKQSRKGWPNKETRSHRIHRLE